MPIFSMAHSSNSFRIASGRQLHKMAATVLECTNIIYTSAHNKIYYKNKALYVHTLTDFKVTSIKYFSTLKQWCDHIIQLF